MKNIVFIITVCIAIDFAAHAQQTPPVKQKRDTVRDIKNFPKPKVVTNRSARIRLQEKQINYHQKQLKKVHKAQNELHKELNKPGQ